MSGSQWIASGRPIDGAIGMGMIIKLNARIPFLVMFKLNYLPYGDTFLPLQERGVSLIRYDSYGMLFLKNELLCSLF